MSAPYIQVHFRLDSFMEANNMNPDQIALKSSLIWVHIVCYVAKNISRREEQTRSRDWRENSFTILLPVALFLDGLAFLLS